MTSRAQVARVLLAFLAFLAIGLAAGPGLAAAACPSPWGGNNTCVFGLHGNGYFAGTGSVTVPAGVTSIRIEMAGAPGGGGYGGCAGQIAGVLPTMAGEHLSLIAGGAGGYPKNSGPSQYPGVGGGGGGAAGGTDTYPTQVWSAGNYGFGGGGGSFLFGPHGLIMAAGGGGGEGAGSGSGSYGGSVAGVANLNCTAIGAGGPTCAGGGQPGTGSGGGLGGATCAGGIGGDGTGPATSTSSVGTGGTGGQGIGDQNCDGAGGGGGGGGYYGGGGGGGAGDDPTNGCEGDGGGGPGSNYGSPQLSSYTVERDTNDSTEAGWGWVRLSYTHSEALLRVTTNAPTNGLVPAGDGFRVFAKYENLSATDTLAVESGVTATGNATLIGVGPAGSPQPPSPGPDAEVPPQPILRIPPGGSISLDYFFQTYASQSRYEPSPSLPPPAGGTRAYIHFDSPVFSACDGCADANLVTNDGNLVTDPSKLEIVGSLDYTVHIDDSVEVPPAPFGDFEVGGVYVSPYTGIVFTAGFVKSTLASWAGLVVGLGKLVVNTVFHPVATAQGVYGAIGLYFDKELEYEASLYNAVKNDPEARALFDNAIGQAALDLYSNMHVTGAALGNLVQQAVNGANQILDEATSDYSRGDVAGAATLLGDESGDVFGTVSSFTKLPFAVGEALGIPKLLRLASAAKALASDTAKVEEEVGQKLAPIAENPYVTAAESVRAIDTTLKAGYVFTKLDEVARLFGLTPEEIAYLREVVKGKFTGGKRLIITIRGRSQAAIQWLAKGAWFKPSWIKIKTVSLADTFIGWDSGDIGRLVIRRPLATLVEDGRVVPDDHAFAELLSRQGVEAGSEQAAAIKQQWLSRIDEWNNGDTGYVRDLLGLNGKEFDNLYNWSENITDPAVTRPITPGGFKRVRFRICGQGGFGCQAGSPKGLLEVAPVEPNGHVGAWRSITGDDDLAAIQNADETIPPDKVEVDALDALSKGPTNVMHPATLTWVKHGEFWFGYKFRYLANSGKCCLLQIGPDGVMRAVQWSPASTESMKSLVNATTNEGAQKAIVHWIGGYADLEPIQPEAATPVPGPAGDQFRGWPASTPWSNPTAGATVAFAPHR